MDVAKPIAVAMPQDFPAWLHPLVVKELRLALRSPWLLGAFLLMHGLRLLVVYAEWCAVYETYGHHGMSSWGRGAFWGAAYGLMGLVIPLRGFEALREEACGSNVELLLVAGLSRWTIMRGKWLTQMILAALVTTNLLPYLVVRYFFGAFDFWYNLLQLIVVILCATAINGLVLGISGYQSLLVRFVLLAIVIGNTFVLGFAMASLGGGSIYFFARRAHGHPRRIYLLWLRRYSHSLWSATRPGAFETVSPYVGNFRHHSHGPLAHLPSACFHCRMGSNLGNLGGLRHHYKT